MVMPFGNAVSKAGDILNRATIRQWHSYIGLFTAPSVLFFALTGALRLFHPHEAHGDYKPLPLIEKLGPVHKNQEFAAGPRVPAEGLLPGGIAVASGIDGLRPVDRACAHAAPDGRLVVRHRRDPHSGRVVTALSAVARWGMNIVVWE